MAEVWIIDDVRSPRGIGKQDKGALAHLHPQRLLSQILRALAERNSIETSDVDDVLIGCGTQAGKQGYDIARMAALDAGYSIAATGATIERFCGSGLTSVNYGAMAIASGFHDLVIAGGVEMMSYTSSLSRPPLMDAGNLSLRAKHPQFSQGLAADIIATIDGFSRAEVDSYAFESHRRSAQAASKGHFAASTVAVLNDDCTVALGSEEYLRHTTMEALAGLKPSFAALMDRVVEESGLTHGDLVRGAFPGLTVDHIHHPGNSSGVVDGAAAVLLASPEYARKQGWRPRARIRAIANAGDSPALMLTATVPSARKALARAGMKLSDIDLFEVNEAFAVVPLKFMRDLDLEHGQVNVNGGAIGLGHPIGATGAMLVGTLVNELERRNLATGLVTLCTGGRDGAMYDHRTHLNAGGFSRDGESRAIYGCHIQARISHIIFVSP